MVAQKNAKHPNQRENPEMFKNLILLMTIAVIHTACSQDITFDDDFLCDEDSQVSTCSAGSGSEITGQVEQAQVPFVSEALFNEMFPARRNNPDCPDGENVLTYAGLQTAAAFYPAFANGPGATDVEKRRELAAFLAQVSHETTGGHTFRDRYGLCFPEELRCISRPNAPEIDPGCLLPPPVGYIDNQDTIYPPVAGKEYHGRGAIQLSHNANYGQFSEFYFGDKNVLLNNPERVLEPELAWASAVWFWMTVQPPKPSAHQVMYDTQGNNGGGRPSTFGHTTNIINGGLECGSNADNDGVPEIAASRRQYFLWTTEDLAIPTTPGGFTEDAYISCASQPSY
jgi:hypothetical protein